MIKGKTQTGFEYEISPENLNNYELIENIAEMDTNPVMLTKVIKQMLGNDETNRLKEHIRNKNGIVEMKKMADEIVDIFQNSGNETKNS